MKKQFIIMVVLLSAMYTLGQSQQIKQITSVEAEKILKSDKSFVVLDVRTPGEFNAGHIKGATNIDVHNPDAGERYKKLNTSSKYMVICRTQNRSGVVVNFMAQNGFKTVYQVVDGMTGWVANGLPIEK